MAYVKRVCSLVVGVACVAVAGCSPSPVASPSPSPSPSAAFLCVPEAGGDPVVCGPIEFEQAQRRDVLYAEAEAVYRRYWVEVQRVELSAHPVVTPELEVVTEPRFRELLREAFVQAEGRQRVEGEGSVVWVRRAPGVSRYGSVVAVDACTDGRNARYREREGDAEPGGVVEHRLFFTRSGVDAGLRIVGSEFVDIETC